MGSGAGRGSEARSGKIRIVEQALPDGDLKTLVAESTNPARRRRQFCDADKRPIFADDWFNDRLTR